MDFPIQICPIKQLYRLLAESSQPDSVAILSSASPVDTSRLGNIRYVFRQYEDLDYPQPGRAFSREDAESFSHFIRSLTGCRTLYCCCDAGERRSPAVAAAVMRYWSADDMLIWRNPKYHPNMLVFDLLTDALGIPVTDDEKDFRLYENRKAFRDAVRKTR